MHFSLGVSFFFNDTATTEIYTLSLHDALPISALAERYLAILQERGLAGDATAPAFVHPDGRPIDLSEVRVRLEHAQRTRLSVEFNAAFCRGMLKTRYGEAEEIPGVPDPAPDPRQAVRGLVE